jgi:hypothetical protein
MTSSRDAQPGSQREELLEEQLAELRSYNEHLVDQVLALQRVLTERGLERADPSALQRVAASPQ